MIQDMNEKHINQENSDCPQVGNHRFHSDASRSICPDLGAKNLGDEMTIVKSKKYPGAYIEYSPEMIEVFKKEMKGFSTIFLDSQKRKVPIAEIIGDKNLFFEACERMGILTGEAK